MCACAHLKYAIELTEETSKQAATLRRGLLEMHIGKNMREAETTYRREQAQQAAHARLRQAGGGANSGNTSSGNSGGAGDSGGSGPISLNGMGSGEPGSRSPSPQFVTPTPIRASGNSSSGGGSGGGSTVGTDDDENSPQLGLRMRGGTPSTHPFLYLSSVPLAYGCVYN